MLRLMLPCAWLLVVLFFAIAADWLPMPSPTDMDFAAAEQGPSAAHLLGADLDGRDILSRLAYGARVSLTVSLIAPLIGLVFGSALGLFAAYYGGAVRTAILALLDAMLAFPSLVFALGLTVVLGPSVQNVTLALGVMSIPAFARIARANALPLIGREFVLAARTAGASDLQIMVREILPNMTMALLTYGLSVTSVMIVAEGSLSFLGVGVPPPTPSWGGMIADGRESLERVPHVSLIPAAVMFLTVLSLNLLGDSLRQRRGGGRGGLA
ncbi:ABC transporter permease [Variovorax sp. M-6]|uniref:ABC transporter permease n=1 Tax=Variovorax sp. M-6 TaxID=3233041 RepID=UPI003F9B6BA8